jgi:hypothetical protein
VIRRGTMATNRREQTVGVLWKKTTWHC